MNTQKSDELRPCPFCGNDVEVNWISGEPYYNCSNGGCLLSRYHNKYGVHENYWNSRPIEDKLQAEIDELKERPEYSYEDAHKLVNLQKCVREAVEEMVKMETELLDDGFCPCSTCTGLNAAMEIMHKYGLIEEDKTYHSLAELKDDLLPNKSDGFFDKESEE